jgi:hypothetical protein
MTDRRFNEDEVAEIFRQATEAQQQAPQRHLSSGEGLTLAEIQEIGQQVGIAPELVVRAATSLATAGTETSRSLVGFTIGVGRTIELDRKLTEAEWEQLVVDLRETFDARGTVRQDGSFRQWTNGNLQVLLEPTPTGQRVRFRTVKANARALITGGLITAGLAAAMALVGVIGGAHNNMAIAANMAAIAAAELAIGAMQLPGWARLRRKQMEEVAQRLATAQSLLPPPK